MEIYGLNTDYLNDNKVFLKKLEEMVPYRAKRIKNCKSEEEKKRLLAAGILLEKVLHQKGFCEAMVRYEDGKKPYLPKVKDCHFNLSHSGDFVFCVTDTRPVGIDIQVRRRYSINLAERFFQKKEWEHIKEADPDQQEEIFFRYWAVKEGYVKLTGEGIQRGLDKFYVDLKEGIIRDIISEKTSYFREYGGIKNYNMAVVSYEKQFADNYTLYFSL